MSLTKNLELTLNQLRKNLIDSISISDSYDSNELDELFDTIIKERLNLKGLVFEFLYGLELPESILNIISLEKLSVNYTGIQDSFLEGIYKLENLKELTLDNTKTELIPDSLYDLKNLNTLILINNKIEDISSKISKLNKLETLNISENSIEVLPSKIWNISSLRNLHIESNPLSSISADIKKLKYLKKFSFGGHDIDNYNEIAPSLNTVDAIQYSDKRISNIPDGITSILNIDSISFYYCNIVELPVTMEQLQKLTRLEIHRNQVNTIPNNVNKIPNLEIFTCENSSLITVEERFFETRSLKELNLSGNFLREIPLSVGKMTSLERINLSDNMLLTLPHTISEVVNLHTLDLSNNPIQDLPKELSTLPKLRQLIYEPEQLKEDSLFKHFSLSEIAINHTNNENIRVSLLKLPDSVKTAFQRYFSAFDDFWRDVTGKDIDFKVSKVREGLEIEIKLVNDVSIEEIEEKINQYFFFIKEQKSSIFNHFKSLSENYELVTYRNIELEIKATKLEVRVQQLEQDLKLASLEDRQTVSELHNLINHLPIDTKVISLTSENETLWKVLELQSSRAPLQLNNYIENTVNNHIDITISIEQIQDSFDSIKESLPTELKAESESIQNDLDQKKNITDLQSDTGLKNRIRRFFSKLDKAETIKDWVSNIKEISEDAPKALENIKDVLFKFSHYWQKLESSDIVKHVNDILDRLGSTAN